MSYLLFAGEHYHPGGGADDLYAAFDEIDSAKIYFANLYRDDPHDIDWGHILDTGTMEIITRARVVSKQIQWST
jgi:hypothetical protein